MHFTIETKQVPAREYHPSRAKKIKHPIFLGH